MSSRARFTSHSRAFPRRSARLIVRGSKPEPSRRSRDQSFPRSSGCISSSPRLIFPACRKDIAATHLPDGAAYYQSQIKLYTTTDLSARAIHEIGIKEVKRIRAEMDGVIKETGFSGSFPEFLNLLRTDPRFARMESDQVLPGFRDIAKRVDPELPKLFAELPRTPYGIREIPAYQGETAEHYTRGAADGSRAGYFNANVLKGATRRKYEMEALLLHEAVPGHHLQVARAQELKELPEFRRTASTAPIAKGGGSTPKAWVKSSGFTRTRTRNSAGSASKSTVPAGWSSTPACTRWGGPREQAINYLKENSGLSESFIEAEIDRYIVWPGQALAYKIGELKIKELRARAEKALGPKFDIRKFHNALIDDGPIPLDVLERRIDEWIKAQA